MPFVPSKLPRIILPLLLLSLLAGLWAGLLRLGWQLPTPTTLAAYHGPLMVSGFLGGLVALERAVALRMRWAYGAPLLSGLGGIILLLGLPPVWAALLMVLGSGVMLLISGVIVGKERALHTVMMVVGVVVSFV